MNKIITARFTIPPNTTRNAPYKLTILSYLPILKKVEIMAWSITPAATMTEVGFSINNLGSKILPAPGSFDDNLNEPYAPFYPSAANIGTTLVSIDDINYNLQGPPYITNFEFINLDTLVIVAIGMYLTFEDIAETIKE